MDKTRLLKLAAVVFFAFYFFKLLTYTVNARLIADETLYAHFAMVVAHDKTLPRVLPELYGGLLLYKYPPLFHIMGAIVYSIFGINGFYLANIMFLILLLASIFLLVRDYFSEDVALLTCLFVVSAPMTAYLSLYFLQEMLTAFLMFLFFVTLYLVFKKLDCHVAIAPRNDKNRVRYSIAAGLLLGLIILTKQSGIILEAFCLAALLWFAIKKDKDMIKGLLVIIVLSVAVSGRYFLLNLEVVKSFIEMAFPVSNRGVDEIAKLIDTRWHVPKWVLFSQIVREFGWILTGLFFIIIFYFGRYWKDAKRYIVFLLLFIFLFILSFISSAVASRHFLPLVPLISLLGAISICSMVKKDAYRVGITVIVLISGVYSTLYMPDYRASYTLSPIMAEPLAFLKEKTPHDSTILSCWTYATLFYTGRNTTWPVPVRIAPNSPTELFYEEDVSRFYNLLNKYKINYILIDKARIGKEFDSFNYPERMMGNLKELVKQEQAKIVYDTRYFAIVEIK